MWRYDVNLATSLCQMHRLFMYKRPGCYAITHWKGCS